MNRIYRLVFNRSTGSRQAVSEHARTSGPGGCATGSAASAAFGAAGAAVLMAVTALAPTAHADTNLLVGAGGAGGISSTNAGNGGAGGIGGGGGGGSGGAIAGGAGGGFGSGGGGNGFVIGGDIGVPGNGGANGAGVTGGNALVGDTVQPNSLTLTGTTDVTGSVWVGGGGGGGSGGGGTTPGAVGGAGSNGVLDVSAGAVLNVAGAINLGGSGGGGGGSTPNGGTGGMGGAGGNGTLSISGTVNASADVNFSGVQGGNGTSGIAGVGGAAGTGNLTINTGGTLQIGTGGTTGSLNGDVTDNGRLVFNRSNAYDYAGVVSGSGSLVQQGTDVLTLSGNNTYGGGTTVNSGVLQVSADNNLGAATGGLAIDNATLRYGSGFASARAVTMGADGGTFDTNGNDASLNGVISGGALTKTGAGALTLSGNNTYSGGTVLNAGILQVSSDSNLGSTGPDAGLTFDGGTLRLPAPLPLPAVNPPPFVSARDIAVNVNGGTIDVNDSQGNIFSGKLSGGGTLTLKNGGSNTGDPTRLTLSSSNNTAFTGAIQLGTSGQVGRINVEVTGSGTLGTNSNLVDIYNNSELDFNGGGASAGNLKITTHVSPNKLGLNSGVTFSNGASAGTATIINAAGSALILFRDATAAASTLVNGTDSRIYFLGTSTGGSAAIANNGGRVYLQDSSDLSGAAIANAVAGTVNISEATSGISIGELSGDGNVVLGGKVLTVGARGTNSTIGGVISDTGPGFVDKDGGVYNPPVTATGGSLVKTGAGTLTLTGVNTYNGGTTVNGGVLQVSADNNLGDAAGGLALDNGTLRYGAGFASARAVIMGAGGGTLDTNGNDAALSGAISGGALTKAGAGTLTLAGANTYNGGTTVNGGVLLVGADNNLGAATGSLALDNATLRYGAGFASARAVTIGAGGGTFDTNGNDASLSGVISGSSITKTGAGTLTLAGANTYNGGTTVSSGVLQVSADNNLGAATGGLALDNATLRYGAGFASARAVTIGAGSTFDTNGNDASLSGVISGSSFTKTGAGTLALAGANTYSGGTTVKAGVLQVSADNNLGAATGGLALDNATLRYGSGFANARAVTMGAGGGTIDTNGNDAALNGVISGGALTKAGAGTLTLAGANTYNGGTTVNGGVLQVAADNNLGDAASGLVLDNGTLRYGAGFASARAVAMGAGGGTLDTNGNNSSLNGVISGGALTKTGAGALILTAANTYSGGTTVNGGVLQVSADNNLGDAAGGLALDNGTLRYSAGFASARAVTMGTGGGTLDTNGNDAALSGVISGGALTKTGAGTLTLAGANTYTGGTTVNGGVLQVSADDNLGAATGGLALNNATLRYGAGFASARAVTMGAGGSTFDTNGHDASLNGVISGGALTKTGAGALTLTGANTYSGGTTVNTGVLQVSADNNLGAATGGLALNNATLRYGAGFASARAVTIGAGSTFDTNGHDASLNGVISGGALTKTGAGTLTMAGANTYSGGTTVNAGVLQVSADNNLGAATAGLALNNATLRYGAGFASARAVTIGAGGGTFDTNGHDAALNGAISGSSLTKTGAGTLILAGANTYSGGTTLKSGQINVGNNAALGTGAIAMDEGTTLGFTVNGLTVANAVVLTGITDPIIDTGSFTETLTGAISGAGALTKNGSGTLVLSGANNYSGATAVAAGTLRAGAANAFSATSAHTVASGATLDTGGFSQTVASLSNSGTVSLVGAAPGSTLTINGAYSGNAGVIRLGTALGDSGSVTDRLILNGAGASASGKTTVQITNLGGLGARTAGSGINIISAQNGATTTAQTTKDAFALANGHVDAGAFEYRLYAADNSGAGENWYLRSDGGPVTPTTATGAAVAPAAASGPASIAATPLPAYRAEVPLYAALPSVLRQSDLTMLSNLHRRMGDETVTTEASGSTSNRRGWARVIDGTTTIEQSGITAPESNASTQGAQAGVDLYTDTTWHAGLYAGYLRADTHVDGFYGLNSLSRGYAGNLRADTTYLGGYATYANPQGQYADFVLQYGHQDITGTPPLGFASDSSGNSVTASAEVGQRFALGSGWGVEPQAQLIVNRQALGNARISGAVVDQDTATAVIGRIGVRITGDYTTGIGRLQPYGRLNVWHGFGGTDTTSFIAPVATTPISNEIGYTSTEAAIGFTLGLTPATSVYGELGKLFHSGGDTRVSSSVQGSIGLKVKF